MKKLMFGLALLLSAGMTMAQTPEEKAAMKEAKAQLTQAMKLRDAAKTALQAATTAKPADESMVKQNCQEADGLIEKALAGGHIDQKKLFDAYFVKDEVNTFLLNQEFAKYQRKEDVDMALFNESLTKACDGMNGVLKYGNPKDDIQAGVIKAEKVKLAKCQVYYVILMQYALNVSDTATFISACKKYIDYPKIYPAVADLCANPNPSYPDMASNICNMAYARHDWDLMSEYESLAMQTSDEQTRRYMDYISSNSMLLRGDTAAWINKAREKIAKNPASEESEVNIQNLMAIYSKNLVELNKFCDEILAIAPENKLANYGKGYCLFADSKYAEALAYYKKAVETDPDYLDANIQCGLCLFNIADANNKTIVGKRYKSQAEADADVQKNVRSYFEQALPYFEKVRQLVPDDSGKWAYELRTIYNAIGQKDKAKELENY
jgi:tetratricopeptide (TPR) repeat protein